MYVIAKFVLMFFNEIYEAFAASEINTQKEKENKNKHIDIDLSWLHVKTNWRMFMQDVELVIILMWFSNTKLILCYVRRTHWFTISCCYETNQQL